MNSNSKGSKLARTTKEDRLSSLPDCVLCHILSFLPTKYAAATSALSTRWKYVFHGVPNIDLDDSLLLKPPREKQDSTRRSHNGNRDFMNFLIRRLMLCETSFSITEFRLKYRSLPEAAVINSWLATLLSHNVKVVDIELVQSSRLLLPSGIFLSKTLSVLKLSGKHFVLSIPEVVCFPNLKVLSLKDLVLQFEYKNLRLAEDQGYPLLEDLSLDGIRFPKNNEVLEISLPTLKKLAIIGVKVNELSRIEIHTPHLQHLECKLAGSDPPKMQINLHKCESLVSAVLSISLESLAKLGTLDPGDRLWLLNLFTEVTNVKELELSAAFSLVLCETSPFLPQFRNLTHLELAANRRSMWNLLQRTPKLTSLVCSMGIGRCLFPLPPHPGGKAYRVIAQTLRQIKIGKFEGSPDEFAVVRFLLQQGTVLERMIIELMPIFKNVNWQFLTSKNLLNLERGSPRCKIELI